MAESAGNPIQIYHDYKGLDFPRRRLTILGKRIYQGEKIPLERVTTVILCSDYKIRKLNASYRGIDRPTDVLSFPFDDPDLLGEVYISLQRCVVQARRYGLTYSDEICRMFVHGMVHLTGHDHYSPRERAAMEAVERKYFAS